MVLAAMLAGYGIFRHVLPPPEDWHHVVWRPAAYVIIVAAAIALQILAWKLVPFFRLKGHVRYCLAYGTSEELESILLAGEGLRDRVKPDSEGVSEVAAPGGAKLVLRNRAFARMWRELNEFHKGEAA
jgi:hypothetical protein